MSSLLYNPTTGDLDVVLDLASEIKYTPSGELVSTNLQEAVDELEQQVLAIPDPIYYVGTWDASTNTPTLSDSDVGKNGAFYRVNVAGDVDFGSGLIEFAVGDRVVNNGTIWEKWDASDQVTSVNTKIGDVVLTTADISEDTNLYFTDERAQDAVGTILVNSSTIDLTYNDGTPSITASVNDGSITDVKIASGIDSVKIGSGTVSNTEFGYLDGVTSSIQTQIDSKVSIVAGDLTKATFSATTTPTATDITGASFTNAVTRSFNMTMNVVGVTEYATVNIKGIQRGADWAITQQSCGDEVGIVFSITNSGQLQYISSSNYTLSFKADTITI